MSIKTALTIAGSDPSGGAGIQADLKTFCRLHVYGMSVITALTAQNTLGVSGVLDVPSEFVGQQLDAVLSDMPVGAVKTGMLRSASNIETVAAKISRYAIANLVVDPVMASSSGTRLLDPDAVAILRRAMLPLALVVTPNLDEARALTGRAVRTVDEMEAAARDIHAMGARHVLIKGGHLEGDAVDVLYDGNAVTALKGERIPAADAHGTGCVLSAAITGYLANGHSVAAAVRCGKEFVTNAIKNRLRIGRGPGPCDPLGL